MLQLKKFNILCFWGIKLATDLPRRGFFVRCQKELEVPIPVCLFSNSIRKGDIHFWRELYSGISLNIFFISLVNFWRIFWFKLQCSDELYLPIYIYIYNLIKMSEIKMQFMKIYHKTDTHMMSSGVNYVWNDDFLIGPISILMVIYLLLSCIFIGWISWWQDVTIIMLLKDISRNQVVLWQIMFLYIYKCLGKNHFVVCNYKMIHAR